MFSIGEVHRLEMLLKIFVVCFGFNLEVLQMQTEAAVQKETSRYELKQTRN